MGATIRRVRRAAFTAIQVLITAGIVWWVFRDPAKRAEMASTLVRANGWWLVAGFMAYGITELISAVRWQILLRMQNLRLPFRRVFALTMIGVFFNFFIPGGTGGDAVKMFYLVQETPGRRGAAILSVIVDRLIGLLALIILAGGFIAAKWEWLHAAPGVEHWVYISLGVLGVSLAFLGVSFLVSGLGLVHLLPVRMPGRDKLAELAMAYNVYGRAWIPSGVSFLLSIVAHFTNFGVFYCAIRALGWTGMQIPRIAEFYAVMPIIGTITALPISVGGVGVREQLFQEFLGTFFAATAGVAVAISSTGYLLTLAWGLIGGLIYLCYRPSEHARLRDIREEVRQLEHEVAEEEVAIESLGSSKTRKS
jgi:uncharacterized membrane protein YbhN (UPF0104 family)